MTSSPTTTAPVTSSPITNAPVTSRPTTAAPVTSRPSLEAVITRAPTTLPPSISDAPVLTDETSSPTSLSPTDEVATTTTNPSSDPTSDVLVFIPPLISTSATLSPNGTVGAKTAMPVPEPTVARTLSPTNATTQTNTTSPTLNSTQSGVPVDTPRPSGKSVISPSPTPLPGDRTVSAEFAALMQDFQSNNLARTSVDGYLTIGAGQCLSSDQPGVAPINDYQYNGLQVVGSVTTPLKCAQSCEICLCGLGFRGFYYVGFELTASNKCNCLLNYDTLPGNLTRDDLGMIAGECSLFDSNSIIPSTGSLYTGTGPVIGSVGFGDQYLCYSVSGTLNRVAEGDAVIFCTDLFECTVLIPWLKIVSFIPFSHPRLERMNPRQ